MVKEILDAPSQEVDEDQSEKGLSAFQIKERKQRTLFVGNIPLDATLKQIKKLFKVHGKVQKVWFRSIATT